MGWKSIDFDWGSIAARICITAIFLGAGVSKITSFSETVDFVKDHLPPVLAPYASFVTLSAAAMELGGGLGLLLGVYIRLSATILIMFLLPVTFLVHYNVGNRVELIMFLKNLSIIGCLYFIRNLPLTREGTSSQSTNASSVNRSSKVKRS